jgi:hypothetical protein
MTRYGTDPLSGGLFTFGQRLRSAEHMNLILPWLRGFDTAAQLLAVTNWPYAQTTGVSTSDRINDAVFFEATNSWVAVGLEWGGSSSAIWNCRHPAAELVLQSPTDIGELSCCATDGSSVVVGSRDTGSTAQKFLVSADAYAWTARNLSGATTERVQGLLYDTINSQFIAVLSGDKIETSPTGTTWTAESTSGSGFDFEAIASDGTSLIVAACSGTATSFDSSPDGATWTARTVPSGDYIDIVYHSGWEKWFASTTTGVIESTDGTTWAAGSATHPSTDYDVKMVEFGDYMIALAVTSTGLAAKLFISDDECVTWNQIHSTYTRLAVTRIGLRSSGSQLCAVVDDEILMSLRAPLSL